MSASDPELTRLLIEELARHLVALEARPVERESAVRAVHALKGSAGLAGERDLSSTLERLHRRMKDGDERAYAEAAELVRTAISRLRAGETAIPARWPEPPDDLVARPLDPLVRAQYTVEVANRLARIDEALATEDEPLDAVSSLYRQVHTMKGAASAVGDEPMGWFCHGLEERLKSASSSEEARAIKKEVASWRAVLAALLDDPEGALRTLRTATGRKRLTSQVPARSSVLPLDEEAPRSFGEDATVRVSAVSIDKLIDRLEAIDMVRERIAVRGERAKDLARLLRETRGGLIEALRLIGPPRPWGAPAAALRRIEAAATAITAFGDEVEQGSGGLRNNSGVLKQAIDESKRQLSAMRQMPVGRIFARLTTAIESEARREGRAIIVRSRGADEAIDRRLAELLIEPCIQLVRNAIAHGIEPPATRTADGKSPSGTISLAAKKTGNRLSITIQDDGAGVDASHVRARAVAAGLVAADIAEAADDEMMLTLLFVPGFSTKEGSDLLAGRGIGLDVARTAVQRLGGTLRLASRRREGFSARIDVPTGVGLAPLLWISAGGEEYAVPAANVALVRANDAPPSRVPHLVACIEAKPSERAAYAMELDVLGEAHALPEQNPYSGRARVIVGVDGVGRTEDLLLRPLTPLVAGLGPFSGAILRGDGSLRLAIDPYAIAARARALARVPERASDDPPSGRRAQSAKGS